MMHTASLLGMLGVDEKDRNRGRPPFPCPPLLGTLPIAAADLARSEKKKQEVSYVRTYVSVVSSVRLTSEICPSWRACRFRCDTARRVTARSDSDDS